MNLQESIRRILREERTDPKENPVKYYYYNYLNENPIEFEGLFLVPKWTGLQIKWKVENPNDYSYSKSVLTQVLYDEFNSFFDMTNTDFNQHVDISNEGKQLLRSRFIESGLLLVFIRLVYGAWFPAYALRYFSPVSIRRIYQSRTGEDIHSEAMIVISRIIANMK